MINLDPTRGREQAGPRPALVISSDGLNSLPADLAIIVPGTTRDKRIRTHVRVDPPEGSVQLPTFFMPEHVRSVSRDRFDTRWGRVSDRTLKEVTDRLRLVLEM